MILLAALGTTAVARGAPEEAPPGATPRSEAPQEAARERARVGVEASLLGPNAIVGGGIAVQPIPLLESALWVGYNAASATESSGTAEASANATLLTVLARGRLWPLPHHSIVGDLGLGLTHIALSASGSDLSGNTFDYERRGTPLLGTLGVGYGYRSRQSFRLAVLGGAQFTFAKLPAGTSTAGGGFTENDRLTLQDELDDIGDDLTKVRAYVELSVGLLF